MWNKSKLIIAYLLFTTLSLAPYQGVASEHFDSEEEPIKESKSKAYAPILDSEELKHNQKIEKVSGIKEEFWEESPYSWNDFEESEESNQPLDIHKIIEKMEKILTPEIIRRTNTLKGNSRASNFIDDDEIPYDLRDVPEIEEYWASIQKIKAVPHAYNKAMKELKRLMRVPANSSEFSEILDYLNYLVSLPWGEKDNIVIDIQRAKEVLDGNHSGLQDIKDRIIEDLAVRKRNPNGEPPILCFVGPPGVGKTTLAMAIAKAVGRKFISLRLGGVADESKIRGFQRTYLSSMPGDVIKALIQAGTSNPLMLLDEVDKLGTHSNKGDPEAALLEVLDRSQNDQFQDHYMQLPFDLSDVMFIATANSQEIAGPLLDRMEIIELSGYTLSEKMDIAKTHLLPKVMKKNGLEENEFAISGEALESIINGYTAEAGVRNLERCIGSLCRKTILKIDEEGETAVAFNTSEDVKEFLGKPIYKSKKGFEEDRVGVTQGLAYTPMGGLVLPIEVKVVPGKGNIITTGNLGKVMEESTTIASVVAREFLREAGVRVRNLDNFFERDIYIHAPAGGTPKDGPSGGITITTSLVSALTDIPVRKDVAMTGEISLNGDVMRIGGLKEKLIGAYNAGMSLVLIPKDNEDDLDDLPEEVLQNMRILPVEHISEVLDNALVK